VHPSRTRLEASAWALLALQVVHGFTPADTEAEGYVGLVGGLALLLATMVAIAGIRRGRAWAPSLTGITGAVVAVGFVLYHALPFKSPVTNPYFGEPVGAPAWISVALCIAAGAWAVYEGLVVPRARERAERRSPRGVQEPA
jgi:drug/metabolite transporter (DMT)-like permease